MTTFPGCIADPDSSTVVQDAAAPAAGQSPLVHFGAMLGPTSRRRFVPGSQGLSTRQSQDDGSAVIAGSLDLESRQLNRAFVRLLGAAIDLSTMPVKRYPPGQLVVRCNDRPTALPVVEAGALDVIVSLDAEGHRVIPIRFQRGEIALPSTLFSDDPVRVDLRVSHAATLRWLPRAAVERAVGGDPKLALMLVRFLAQRLREVQLRERGWMGRGNRDRICAALARAAHDAVPLREDPIRVLLTHGEVAERAAVSRPKVSRELKLLERAGLLRLHRGAIEIVAPNVLWGAAVKRH